MDEKTFEIINRIAYEHSNKEFGYLKKEDLQNEIWVICLQKLNDFDFTKGELEHFLRVAVKNRLINRFKEVTKSVRSPCPRCKYFKKGEDPDCGKFGEDRHLCSKWRNYGLSVDSRNSLLNASEQQFERHSRDNLVNQISAVEIQNILLDKIPKNLKHDLQKFMIGNKLSKQRMKKLKIEIFKILEKPKAEKLIQLTLNSNPIKE